MAFRIELARAAELDIADAAEYISRDSPVLAQRWLEGLFQLIASFENMPTRHALIPEAEQLKRQLRSVHYQSHRIVYEVREDQSIVYVARIYHGARRPLSARDVD